MEKSERFFCQCQPMNQAVTETPNKTFWYKLLHSNT